MIELKIPVDTFQPKRDIRKKSRNYKVELLGKEYYSRLGYKVYGIYDSKKNKEYFLQFLKRHNLPNNYKKIISMMDEKGAPDLFLIKNDNWFFSEVKAFHNKLTENQNKWLKKFNDFLKKNNMDDKQRIRLLYIFPKMWIEELE